MGTKRTLVEIEHDEGYGDNLLMYLNAAIGTRDMRAVRILRGCEAEIESAAPVITLRLEIELKDSSIVFERPAPLLPDGLQWQVGMLFDDGCFPDGEMLRVDHIEVLTNGSVVVVFCESYHSTFANDESITEHTNLGWRVSSVTSLATPRDTERQL